MDGIRSFIVDEQQVHTSRGGILYDASRLRKPGDQPDDQPDDQLFTPDDWRKRGELEELAGGRGSISILRAGDQRWVLRHYRRGGFMAKLSRDRYWWLGAQRTRSFAEWRLLKELRQRNLPVPAPIAARYVRGILTYQADLITEQLPSTRTLADSITGSALPDESWRAVGKTIAAFHSQGVHHADLNANNILLSTVMPAVYLLDFDRGRLRERGSWEIEVLERLHRSLSKIAQAQQQVQFGEREWVWLKEGYGEAVSG